MEVLMEVLIATTSQRWRYRLPTSQKFLLQLLAFCYHLWLWHCFVSQKIKL